MLVPIHVVNCLLLNPVLHDSEPRSTDPLLEISNHKFLIASILVLNNVFEQGRICFATKSTYLRIAAPELFLINANFEIGMKLQYSVCN